MNDTKFTNGVWTTEKTESGVKVNYSHGFLTSSDVIKIDESRQEGESWLDMRNRTESARQAAKEESNANMYLIAAAPEMYAQLAELRDSMAFLKGDDYELVVQADKVLAKARGE